MEKFQVDERARAARAKAFAQKWAGRGYEKGDTHSFWLELLRDVVGMEDVTTNVRFERSTSERGYIDVVIPGAKTVIEQKSLGIDLDKPEMRQGVAVTPFAQAKRYADSLPNSQRPDTIIVSDFDHFRIHDLDTEQPGKNYVSFRLDELPQQLHLLDFLIDPQRARAAREEQVSLDAGALIGKVYRLLRAQYVDPDSPESRHALNVLCVRLVFCLFAEDAGLFPKDAFYNYLKGMPTRQVRVAMKELFAYLRAKPEERDPYASDELRAFPYVNGGLFEAEVEVPSFTDEIVEVLLEEVSHGTNWSEISPTVFGGVFESTLNPETRRSGGMHYTSPENIHRLIDPLFLDGLKSELDAILMNTDLGDRARRFALEKYHDRLAGLTFFDPACGSGNFLTETYISLRRLENKVLSELLNNQGVFGLTPEDTPLKVSLEQFHGIEINDFAVNVASTAMWIAELQANAEAQTIVFQAIQDLPLRDSAHIVLGNALDVDWQDVLPADQCDYIIGNPPFRGARYQTAEQKAELAEVFGGARNAGNVDYVSGWFMKAAQYMGDRPIRAAFVATNSICQGEQVANVWAPIYELGFRIDFAHDTFRWTNEAADAAAVFVVIVGFSKQGGPKRLYHYATVDSEPVLEHPEQLNAYLKDAPDVLVWNRSIPLCDVPRIGIGNKPIDGGNYLFTPEEKADFLAIEPGAEQFFHRWFGSVEFIRGVERWVLWLGEATPGELAKLPESVKRVQAVRNLRAASKSAPTRAIAATPTRFHVENMPEGESILIPEVSSERRRYIPMGHLKPGDLASSLVRLIPNASLYHFGVLHSRTHNAWMRTVAGRLKSDYRYSGGIVYNNFVWPEATEAQKTEIAELAQAVLDARTQYPDSTISQMYDPNLDFMFPALTAAHSALDAAVERAYGLEPGLDEKDVVAHLFELYSAAVGH
ncbi:class I SAM-dependent DNA methyltransferase [Brachybacterium muris]|uniref:site-specific DNA-methyltransferase (adenine-specific) n=1 Tax=Brachybacterium muris UCD-AY4 TaxID=1249481 RepID=A0A022KWJ4_9MICO|nr:DNA methyltransferase [Brachybacterium muris]EYT50517.1 DNA methyltransferase [Brachybacterium muris UCD-AY4]